MSGSDLDDFERLGVSGLAVRAFGGEADYPALAAFNNALDAHEGVVGMSDVETVRVGDQWDPDFDPPRDRVMVELHGKLIGMGRAGTGGEPDGSRIYWHSGNLLPEWRGKNIEPTIYRHNERRLLEISHKHPDDKGRFLRVGSIAQTNPEAALVLGQLGYQPIRHSFQMRRPHLENIPDAPLPAGVEARPVGEGDERAIWNANLEAFRDHWGFQEPPANGFAIWRQNPLWNRSLSRVAWAGGEVAGMVLIHAPRVHDAASEKVAETEQICVRRAWRRKGVATALIALCLKALNEAGFQAAALGVDGQNVSGALRIYERMGYQVRQRYSLFQKPMG